MLVIVTIHSQACCEELIRKCLCICNLQTTYTSKLLLQFSLDHLGLQSLTLSFLRSVTVSCGQRVKDRKEYLELFSTTRPSDGWNQSVKGVPVGAQGSFQEVASCMQAPQPVCSKQFFICMPTLCGCHLCSC